MAWIWMDFFIWFYVFGKNQGESGKFRVLISCRVNDMANKIYFDPKRAVTKSATAALSWHGDRLQRRNTEGQKKL